MNLRLHILWLHGERIQRISRAHHQILLSVEHICLRTITYIRRQPRVPKYLTCGRIESDQILGAVSREQKLPRRSQHSSRTTPTRVSVFPRRLTGLVIDSPQRAPESARIPLGRGIALGLRIGVGQIEHAERLVRSEEHT